MKKISAPLKDAAITVSLLFLCFILCLLIQNAFGAYTLIPAVFILGSFLTSLITDGYICGFVSAIASVFIFDFAFELPYFQLNFTITDNLVTAVIMIIISFVTCTLTTKLKKQEAVRAESEKEKMRADLLRAISHDLRTPLTTIYGASSALLENDRELSPQQKKKMLESIREDADWLTRMVENLLSITRLDGKNVKLLKTSTVLDEFVDAALIKFHKRYPEQEVTVNLPDEFITIEMDALLVEQVVINILENAVYHAKGMTILCLKAFTVPGKVVFEITDDGCGLEKDRLKHIFKGYYNNTEDLPSDSRRSNAGIGLRVCSAIIRAHGGTIEAANLKSKGAVFRFALNTEEEAHE
ncbi:MAG: PAS domain-containing sensor histidine kinase [Lachnospiraceae bacterium]|nr:PAS domain-containing sensor histidine kinase [Lachnospiraceae bacterium]